MVKEIRTLQHVGAQSLAILTVAPELTVGPIPKVHLLDATNGMVRGASTVDTTGGTIGGMVVEGGETKRLVVVSKSWMDSSRVFFERFAITQSIPTSQLVSGGLIESYVPSLGPAWAFAPTHIVGFEKERLSSTRSGETILALQSLTGMTHLLKWEEAPGEALELKATLYGYTATNLKVHSEELYVAGFRCNDWHYSLLGEQCTEVTPAMLRLDKGGALVDTVVPDGDLVQPAPPAQWQFDEYTSLPMGTWGPGFGYLTFGRPRVGGGVDLSLNLYKAY